jgi:hypothetical protein
MVAVSYYLFLFLIIYYLIGVFKIERDRQCADGIHVVNVNDVLTFILPFITQTCYIIAHLLSSDEPTSCRSESHAIVQIAAEGKEAPRSSYCRIFNIDIALSFHHPGEVFRPFTVHSSRQGRCLSSILARLGVMNRLG